MVEEGFYRESVFLLLTIYFPNSVLNAEIFVASEFLSPISEYTTLLQLSTL